MDDLVRSEAPKRRNAIILATLIVLGLVACSPIAGSPVASPPTPTLTPTPTPTPTSTPTPAPTAPPGLDELVLTTEGLGTLTIGEPPALDLPDSMVFFDPNACVSEGMVPEGSPDAGRWRPTYPGDPRPFGVAIDESGALTRIDIYGDIPTDSGLRRDGSIDDLIAAYPEYATPVITGYATGVWVIPGERGQLLVEAMLADYDVHAAGEIVAITLIGSDRPAFGKYGSDNTADGCL